LYAGNLPNAAQMAARIDMSVTIRKYLANIGGFHEYVFKTLEFQQQLVANRMFAPM
jgi:hypothetical protein